MTLCGPPVLVERSRAKRRASPPGLRPGAASRSETRHLSSGPLHKQQATSRPARTSASAVQVWSAHRKPSGVARRTLASARFRNPRAFQPLILPHEASAISFLTARDLLSFSFFLIQQDIQTLEALVPEVAITLHPASRFRERLGLEPAQPALRFAAFRNQAGALQDLEVLGDGGLAYRERFGEL